MSGARAWWPGAALVLGALAACGGDGGGVETLRDTASDGSVAGDVLAGADADAGPAVLGVSPRHVSARGGAEVTVAGRGLVAPVTVLIGGAPAEVREVRADAVVVVAPRLRAGPAEMVVTVGDVALAPLVDALTVDPLRLRWVAASVDTVAAVGAGPAHAALAFDVDVDGDLDLVVATDDGLRVLLNDGAGRFTRLERVDPETSEATPIVPGGRGPIRGLATADLDGDGVRELVAATGGGRELVLRGGVTGLEAAGVAPARDGSGEAVTVADLDGDGDDDVAVLVTTKIGRGLVVFRGDGAGGLSLDPTSAPASEGVHGTGSASCSDPAAIASFERHPTPDGGGGEGRLAWTTTEAEATCVFAIATDLPAVPERITVRLRRDAGAGIVQPTVVDGDGATFVGPELSVGGAVVTVEAASAASWERVGDGEGGPVAPITSVGLRVTPVGALPAEGALAVDEITADLGPGYLPALVATFDERTPRHGWPDAAGLLAGRLDGDARADLVVLRGERVSLLGTWGADPGEYVPSALAPDGAGPFRAGALGDGDGDGDLDLVLVSGAQDRLAIGDGWGRFVDATLGALPVDAADGVDLVWTDVDLDGAGDLVIGNRDGTDRLYLGRGDGRFRDATPDFGFDTDATARVVVADLDGDGDDDVISVPLDPAALVRVRFAEDAP